MNFMIDGYELSLTEDGDLHIEDTVDTGDDGIVLEFPFQEILDALLAMKPEYDKLALPSEEDGDE